MNYSCFYKFTSNTIKKNSVNTRIIIIGLLANTETHCAHQSYKLCTSRHGIGQARLDLVSGRGKTAFCFFYVLTLEIHMVYLIFQIFLLQGKIKLSWFGDKTSVLLMKRIFYYSKCWKSPIQFISQKWMESSKGIQQSQRF